MKGNDFLDWHVGHQGKWSLSVRGMREKEGTCQEAESLRGAGGADTKGLCEGEERVWALLGEKVSGAGRPASGFHSRGWLGWWWPQHKGGERNEEDYRPSSEACWY